jgi:hypothetical protein
MAAVDLSAQEQVKKNGGPQVTLNLQLVWIGQVKKKQARDRYGMA